MSEAVWYWREGNEQHGPVTWEKLRSLAESGKVSPSDWVMREGWPDWKLACEANDSSIDMAAVGPLPEPPPLPLPPVQSPAAAPAGAAPTASAALSLQPVAPVATVAMPVVTLSAALPLPLPPLAPQQTLIEPEPAPATGPDGVNQGDVVNLRRVLRDDGTREQPEHPSQWNVPAIAALAASVMGLLFLAFEMGLIGVGLGGWCLYTASAGGNPNGRNLALSAVIIGGINVAFRVLCASVDLGLTHI